jgi:hypothetical protein
MRKVQSFDLFMGNSHSPTFLFAGRALARKSSGEGDSHTPAQRQCKRSRFTFSEYLFLLLSGHGESGSAAAARGKQQRPFGWRRRRRVCASVAGNVRRRFLTFS